MTSPTPISIIGAGLSGLVCARILQLHNVPVTIYELDDSAEARRQGGSLDIHDDTGQVALKAAGLWDQAREHAHPSGESMRVMDKHAHVFVDTPEPEGGNGRPEIDRTVLRQLLIESLAPGTIQWGCKLVRLASDDHGNTLEFANGATVRADVVVGADGAWSRVRTALSPEKPAYTGITITEFRLTDAATKYPESRALVGPGSVFALSDNKYIGGHGGDHLSLGVGLRVPEDWITATGITGDDPAAARETLLRELADWAEPLTDLIRHSDDTIWPRPIYALPIGFTWPRSPRITLIGDAAHVMSPFAGEGANLALIDGADLASELLSHDDPASGIAAYERRMVPRGAKSAKASQKGLERMFNEKAPKQIVSFFRRMNALTRLFRPILRPHGQG
ncbi:FAD-dependent oxidoreductase [Humibacter ginsenosidimutans]|uniref:Flavin-dependent monooxygenase n=1 Tax=Humibacter ginsenosidimutans TaxID=2599293 RepID=A0A5B8M519_9MICO|nr:NAD(P)/FAD-dependent oxidoreductase [Humibacter ginsenosidimutans]QDZ15818.1 FAD-dependent monooxygenase [Humibacter ginsenosidimutans]